MGIKDIEMQKAIIDKMHEKHPEWEYIVLDNNRGHYKICNITK